MRKTGMLQTRLSAYHDEVTGSRTLLGVSFSDDREYRILIDCGYYQEVEYRYLNYVDDINPATIDAILITHNHIDHTGLIPKMVKKGFKGKIYMTTITRELLPLFLYNSADQQEDNAKYLRDKYPENAWKFKALYHKEDVRKSLDFCIGLNYKKTLEILPGVKITYFMNGHLLGAGMLLVQIKDPSGEKRNYFFTGDYKMTNPLFKVEPLPKWITEMELIMIHESTYGTTKSDDIKTCFVSNLLEAFEKNQDVLIGAFAQGRMQEVLYDLKLLQNANLIPSYYEIYLDGNLGIETTFKYVKILEKFNPETSDFLPKGLKIVEPSKRNIIINSKTPKIIITTSGMLSNGPARQYVPIFIERSNAMIHLIGYAAEETLARTLLESKTADTITIGNKPLKKRATVKTTREKTSHVTLDSMLKFINQFENVIFLGVNHGQTNVKQELAETISINCKNVRQVDILDRNYVFTFYSHADSDNTMVIKKIPAKLQVVSPDSKTIKKERKIAKKEKRREQKRKRKIISKKKNKHK